MEQIVDEWHDPLIITDVSFQQVEEEQQSVNFNLVSSDSSEMEQDLQCSQFDVENGHSMVRFSTTSPDLVRIDGSPDMSKNRCEDSPEFLKSVYDKYSESSLDLSFEKCIDLSKSPDVNLSPMWQEQKEDVLDDSFALLPPPILEDNSSKEILALGSIESEECTFKGLSSMEEIVSLNDGGQTNMEEKLQKLFRENELQKKELTETRSVIEELKRENQLKTRECQEACRSLQDLQNELMRKSMHVGSLAFAIEGQVKEKSRWFSTLRDLTRKLKIMKMEQIDLSNAASAYNKCLNDFNEMNSALQSAINHQVHLHEDLKVRFMESAKERKSLYNKVLELKGNIRVFCRCRPLNPEEIASGAPMAVDFDSAKDGELTVKSNGFPKKTFKFDAVFSPRAEQVDVFEDTAPFAVSALDGYNVCIFAYGQTGTGKTFTMEGTEDARGVNFRILDELFRVIKERERQVCYDISVSVLEVYNEQIRDLLVSGAQPGVAAAKRLEVRQVGEGIHHVPGLVEAHVSNMSQVWEVLQTGSNARAVGSTNANEYSSRSHCLHCVMVKGENLLNGECTRSKMWLVDLAGSERIAKTEVQGERLKEAQNINRSLSALGDVISALSTKSPHIPFRNSKLTHLLQDSLGGDSKTLMFVQISPNENDLSETLCSLNFASRVRGVELGPAKRQVDTTELLKFKQTVEKTRLDLRSKDVQISKMDDTIHVLETKVKERDIKNKFLQDKVKELESQLLVERKLARQHIDTKIAEQQHQLKPQQEEQTPAAMRPPLASRPLGSYKSFNEPNSTTTKEQVNLTRLLNEYKNRHKQLVHNPPTEFSFQCSDIMEKENNPEMAEQCTLPKRTGRASICTTARQISIANFQPRRNSLIPDPKVLHGAHLTSPFLPLPTFQENRTEEGTDGTESNLLPVKIAEENSKGITMGTKKLNSILRRSLQKKIHINKSGMQQHARKGGVHVGMEKVRVSIGSKGRMGYRVLLGNGKRMVTKDYNHKEKGWSIGMAGRTLL